MAQQNSRITLDMIEMHDSNGDTYWLVSPDLPASINLDQCNFMVFIKKGRAGASMIIQSPLPGKSGPEILEQQVNGKEAVVRPWKP